ncbi:MAG: DUF3822 family protein [Dysgonamonadaceae bacterium]|jgi:hypothetical protein|nr:DUF3822 family protein [Dysgonamonadaceae bacterium]
MKIRLPESVFQQPEQFVLVILLHPSRCSLMIFSPDNRAGVFFADDSQERLHGGLASFREWFFENELFALPFKDVRIINHSHDYTFLPAVIDANIYGPEFIKYISSKKGGTVINNKIEKPELQIVHRIPESTYQFFLRSFINPEFIHHSAPLLEYFSSQSSVSLSSRMYICCQGNEMDIICFASGGKLLLFNTYHVRNVDDMIYFISFTWKQMKLNQKSDVIYLAGDIETDGELAQNLRPFIRNIDQSFSGDEIPVILKLSVSKRPDFPVVKLHC